MKSRFRFAIVRIVILTLMIFSFPVVGEEICGDKVTSNCIIYTKMVTNTPLVQVLDDSFGLKLHSNGLSTKAQCRYDNNGEPHMDLLDYHMDCYWPATSDCQTDKWGNGFKVKCKCKGEVMNTEVIQSIHEVTVACDKYNNIERNCYYSAPIQSESNNCDKNLDDDVDKKYRYYEHADIIRDDL